jgi:hypothetical protein
MNGWSSLYEYLASPLTPQWFLVIVGAVAAYYALRAFHAAKKQADAAETTLRTIQRPNVFCSKIDIIHFATDERPAITVHFFNQGGTPAVHSVFTVDFQLLPNTIQPSAPMCAATLNPNLQQGPYTVASGQSVCLPVAFHRVLTIQDSVAISHGAMVPWVYGAIIFFDTINKRQIVSYFIARYIVFGADWLHKRPNFPSDFWIFNDITNSTWGP